MSDGAVIYMIFVGLVFLAWLVEALLAARRRRNRVWVPGRRTPNGWEPGRWGRPGA